MSRRKRRRQRNAGGFRYKSKYTRWYERWVREGCPIGPMQNISSILQSMYPITGFAITGGDQFRGLLRVEWSPPREGDET